jgi:hypothetical protein
VTADFLLNEEQTHTFVAVDSNGRQLANKTVRATSAGLS